MLGFVDLLGSVRLVCGMSVVPGSVSFAFLFFVIPTHRHHIAQKRDVLSCRGRDEITSNITVTRNCPLLFLVFSFLFFTPGYCWMPSSSSERDRERERDGDRDAPIIK